jgi:uncharacterized protein YmfQ (DUF2313 family)
MASGREAYLAMILGLLPSGRAWTRDRYSVLVRFLGVFADTFVAVDLRVDDLMDEADPRTVRETIGEWESVAGLPDVCSTPAATMEERRDALVRKVTGIGGASRLYFKGLARAMGYDPDIVEYRPFIAGLSRCATDTLNGGHEVRHTWRVTIHGPRLTWFTVGISRCGERLMSIARAEDLECVFGRLKPAHTHLVVAYRETDGQIPMSESGQIPMSESGQIPMSG